MASAQVFETLLELQRETDYKKRYHRLNNLVHTLSEPVAKDILKDLLYDNPYHVFLRIHIIKRFQLFVNIIEILKGKNITLTENVLRFNFLFKGPSELKTWKFCQENLFPYVSFSTRVKLLNNLTKFNEGAEQVEEFFNGVNTIYTLRQALILLPACSSEFIKKIIVKYDLSLSGSQLHKMVRYHSELGFWYLNRRVRKPAKKHQQPITEHTSELKYLIKTGQLTQFMEFFNTNSKELIQFRVGLRASKQIIRENPEQVLQAPVTYGLLLRRNIIIDKFSSKDVTAFYSALFPKKISSFRYNLDGGYSTVGLLKFIEKLPPSRQLELLVQGFKDNYDINLMEPEGILSVKDVLVKKLIHLLPIKQREQWADAKLEDNPVDHTYLALLPTQRSIPKIKDLLYQASDASKRSNLMESLMDTCFINRDTKAFAKILVFLVDRYRNDEYYVRVTILCTFDKYCEQLDCGPEHWDPIEDCIRMFAVKKEYQAFTSADIIRKCIDYRMKRNQPIDEFVQIIIKAIDDGGYRRWTLMPTKLIEDKQFVVSLLTNVYTLHSKESDYWNGDDQNMVLYLVETVSNWNNNHPNDELPYNLYEFLLTHYERYTEKSNTYSQYEVLYTLTKRPEKLQQLRERLLAEEPTANIIDHFLKTDRQQITTHLNSVVNATIQDGRSENHKYLLRKLRTVTFGDARPVIMPLCQTTIEHDLVNRKCAVNMFCRFADAASANEFFSPYFPTEKKVTEEKDENKHQLCVYIATNIWRIDPVVGFEVIQTFMDTDFLTKCLGSLYSVCLRTQCDVAVAFLNKILTGKVSVRKHILRLLFKIYTTDKVTALLLNFAAETNPSIRFVIVNVLFGRLISEQKRDIFDILLKCILKLNEKDTTAWDKLIDEMERIPDKYFAEYLQSLWQVLDSIVFIDKNNLNEYERHIITHITNETAPIIPTVLFEQILDKHLFDIDGPVDMQPPMTRLATLYLYRTGNASGNLQAVKYLSARYKERLDAPLKDADQKTDNKLRRYSLRFFKDIFQNGDMTVEREIKQKTLQAFTAELRETLLANFAILDLFTLQSTVVTIQEYQNIPAIAVKMAAIYNEFADRFGIETVALFLHELTSSIIKRNSQGDDNAITEYAMNCLKASASVACQIVVAKILPTEMPSDSVFYEQHQALMQQLQNSQNISVRIYFKNKNLY